MSEQPQSTENPVSTSWADQPKTNYQGATRKCKITIPGRDRDIASPPINVSKFYNF